MLRFSALAALAFAASFCSRAVAQTAVVYDGLSAGTIPTFTGSVPRTYMGQGFTIADPGLPVQIVSMRITLVAGAAVNYADSRLRIQFWDTFNPAATGTALAFSNPSGAVQVFSTGALNTTGATAFTFSFSFSTPISLTALANHGLTVNWQSDATGTGTFIDDTLLTTALRTGTGGTVPPPTLSNGAADVNTGGGYFRNASGLTNFNFQANDTRTIANVGGLMFELTAVSIPEPSSVALIAVTGAAGVALFRRSRRQIQS